MTEERTVRNLTGLGERVYVYLEDDRTGEEFLRAAEAEGFTFGDGVKPSCRHYSRLMAVHRDGTVNYVGAMGHMAFGAKAGGLVRADYALYSTGSGEYILQ